MNKLFPVLASVVLLGAGCFSAPVEDDHSSDMSGHVEEGAYTLNIEASSLGWVGYGVGKQHHGNLGLLSGEMTIGEDAATGTVVADMTTITDNDLEGDMAENLVAHLKSDDFFSVEQFPTATFALGALEMLEGVEDGNYRVDGTLTIKDITNDLSFPANVEMTEDGVHLMATVMVDRAAYDVRYGSGSFFEDLGDNLINDEFELTLDLLFSENEMNEGEEGDDSAEDDSASEDGEDAS